MKLNLFEKVVVRLFKKIFSKVYKIGMADSFNFYKSSPPIPYKILYNESNNCNKN